MLTVLACVRLRHRRVVYETEHPAEGAAFVAQQKADKEAEAEKKQRDKVERTALLKAKLAEENRLKQQHAMQMEQQQGSAVAPGASHA